jgi:1-phosphofructokinase
MNPAIDKTVEIEKFQYAGLNRITSSVQDAGGKGVNVSKTIQCLGGDTLATGFLGGSSGGFIDKALQELGIKTDFIWVEGQTRTNLKVIDTTGNVTEINEPGPVIEQEAIEALLCKLEDLANEDALFILAGSIPKGVDPDIYALITKKVKEKGARVFLDADGALFVRGLEAKPDFIKPNRFELEQYFAFKDSATEADLVTMGKKLQEMGVQTVAISLGSEGALFVLLNEAIKTPGLKVEAHSTVGAGDAMVAALAYGIDSKLPIEQCIKIGVSTSAGAVTTIGTKPPSRELVDTLMDKVQLIYL